MPKSPLDLPAQEENADSLLTSENFREASGAAVAAVRMISWRIPVIDGLRGLAMLMVFACHAVAFVGRPRWLFSVFGWQMDGAGFFANGALGVDLFMVLSGFCLFLPVCKSEQALASFRAGSFYRRRVRRIVPPYYAAILYAAILPVGMAFLRHGRHFKPALAALPGTPFAYFVHLFFVQTLFIESFGQINTPLWSMGLEAQFYLLFPLVVAAVRFQGLRVAAGIMAISLAYNLLFIPFSGSLSPSQRDVVFAFFLARWMEFAGGMLAAWVVAHHRRQQRWHSGKRGAGGLGAAVLLYTVAASLPQSAAAYRGLISALLTGAFSLAIICLCSTRTAFGRLLDNRVMVWLGGISYSIFLIHWPTLLLLKGPLMRLHLNAAASFFVLMTAGFGITLVVSYVFHLLIERPFMNAPTSRQKTAAARIAE